MTENQKALLAAYDAVIKGWRDSQPEHYSFTGTVFKSEFAAIAGDLASPGIEIVGRKKIFKLLRASYPSEGELLAAIDRAGKFFDARCADLDKRGATWTAYQNLRTNVGAVNRSLQSGGDTRTQILVVAISYEWAYFCGEM